MDVKIQIICLRVTSANVTSLAQLISIATLLPIVSLQFIFAPSILPIDTVIV